MAHTIYRHLGRLKGKYFIYAHFRVDTSSLFYIGLGTKQGNSDSTHYQRAFAKRGRNSYWKNIINKTQYKVVIVYETDCLEDAKGKEILYISKYKRKLCNMTLGGDIPSDNFTNKKEVYQYSLDGGFIRKWDCAAEIFRSCGFCTSVLNRCLIGKRKNNNAFGYQWFYEYKGEVINKIFEGRPNTRKGIKMYNDTECFFFDSRTAFSKFIKRSAGRASDLVKEGNFNGYKIEHYEN